MSDREPVSRLVLYGCDATRICPCVTNNSNECSDCNGCYAAVRLALHEQRKAFYTLVQHVIDYAENLSNDTFAQRLAIQEDELEMLRGHIISANDLADDIDKRLKDVASKLNEIRTKLDELESLLNMANRTATNAYQLATRIESLVSEVKSKLKMAYDLLSNEGQPKVNSAQQTTAEIVTLANQSATLAAHSETEASDQETQAGRLNSTASMAYRTAVDAKMNAENAVASQNTDKQTLQQLMMTVTNRSLGFSAAKDNVMKAKNEVDNASGEAESAHKRAAEAYVDSGLNDVQLQLAAAQNKTTGIRNRLTYVTNKFSSVVTDINTAYTEISQLSRTIDMATDGAADIKTRAGNAYTKAMTSVKNGNDVITEAKDMLNILTNFSNVINETRNHAIQALERVSMIEEESQNATAAAREILREHELAHNDTRMAVELAEQALVVVTAALTRANEIHEAITTLVANATLLKTDAGNARMDAVNDNTTANNLLESCQVERDTVDDAIEGARDAERNQSMCRNKIQVSAADVERLRMLIANIDRLDLHMVKSLREMISTLDNRITVENLGAVVDALEKQQAEDKDEVDRCDAMIEELERDINNLKLAIAVGKDGCVGVGP